MPRDRLSAAIPLRALCTILARFHLQRLEVNGLKIELYMNKGKKNEEENWESNIF